MRQPGVHRRILRHGVMEPASVASVVGYIRVAMEGRCIRRAVVQRLPDRTSSARFFLCHSRDAPENLATSVQVAGLPAFRAPQGAAANARFRRKRHAPVVAGRKGQAECGSSPVWAMVSHETKAVVRSWRRWLKKRQVPIERSRPLCIIWSPPFPSATKSYPKSLCRRAETLGA